MFPVQHSGSLFSMNHPRGLTSSDHLTIWLVKDKFRRVLSCQGPLMIVDSQKQGGEQKNLLPRSVAHTPQGAGRELFTRSPCFRRLLVMSSQRPPG